MTPSPELSILIVNWKSKDFLRRCLNSIYRKTQGMEFEVIVVDNASFDGTSEMLTVDFPRVRFIQSESNLGFARANNLAFEQCVGRVVLLLNPDTEIVGNAITTMFSALASLPDAGIVGAKLLNTDLSVQTPCIKRFPTILGELLSIEWLRRQLPRCKLWSIEPLFSDSQKPVQVDAVSGACQMIPRSVYEAVGGLSTKYFMYAEDIEISASALSHGWKTYYVGTATIIHHGGQSSIGQERGHRWISVMQREAMWQFFRAWRGPGYAGLYRAMVGFVSLPWLLVVAVLSPALWLRGQGARAARARRKWTGTLEWALGSERLTTRFQGQLTYQHAVQATDCGHGSTDSSSSTADDK